MVALLGLFEVSESDIPPPQSAHLTLEIVRGISQRQRRHESNQDNPSVDLLQDSNDVSIIGAARLPRPRKGSIAAGPVRILSAPGNVLLLLLFATRGQRK
jgi:hypothetical protein